MADNFVTNPFAALDKKHFRDGGKHTGHPNGALPYTPQQSPKKLLPSSAQEDEDARLFLHAVAHVDRQHSAGKTTTKSGFPLQDQQAFSSLFQTQSIDQSMEARENAVFQTAMQETRTSKNKSRQIQKNTQRTATAHSSPIASATQDQDQDLLKKALEMESDTDVSAFSAAMQHVRPLTGKGRAVAPCPPPSTPPATREMAMQDVLDGRLEFALSLTGEYLEGYVVGLDEITMNKLRAGACSPEAHLDLHGLNVEQAFHALLGFMRNAWFKGLRTVLIVPGRGLNSPNGYGVLRDRLQLWLTQEPFKRVVLAFCTAKPADGGPGSVYVLLRKYKKKGRIYWERMPADPDLG